MLALEVIAAIATVVAAAASLVTIGLAYETVLESRRLRREYEYTSTVQRAQRTSELVELIETYFTRGSEAQAVEAQTSLRVLLTGVDADIPHTRHLSARPMIGANRPEVQVEIARARDEAREAVVAAVAARPDEETPPRKLRRLLLRILG
jgi:hypothetical protein